MHPRFDQNDKKLKSLLTILDTMERSKKPSNATYSNSPDSLTYIESI
jgi:hypothetical protein